MADNQIYGYAGKILRVNLTNRESSQDKFEEDYLRKYIGGTALGIKLVYDEVAPGVEWSAPENRLFIGSGPLGGTRVGGSGCVSVVTKGALTEGMACTQANGFFGAFLRFSGFDGIIVQGAAPGWVYIYVHNGIAEIRDAGHLSNKNTYETVNALQQELQKKESELSVLSIGPAGENMVRFAGIFIDFGHAAAHNGVGAVMGSKRLKAIAVERGKNPIPLKDREGLSRIAKEVQESAHTDPNAARAAVEGTVGGVVGTTKRGIIPVKNYTTNVHVIAPDKLNNYTAAAIRTKFNATPTPCWACSASHCHMYEIPEGKYKERVVEEPEYEDMAASSALVGISDVTTTIVLASEVDRLGFDANEAGWLMSWLIECYEKGILTKKDTDGLEMNWGNGEAIMTMLNRIAHRQGFGNVLAEGVMRAAKHVGGEAANMAIHSQKGNTPRGHDHRVVWFEMFDTCVSNTGTLEATSRAPFKLLDLPPTYDNFDPIAVSTAVAKVKGAMIFEDSCVTCRFQSATAVDLLCQAINCATGWDMDIHEAMRVGRRAVNLARAFNLRHGIPASLDAPSARYGSTPPDGAAAGVSIMPHWSKMLSNYYNLMGWDAHGKPLPQTLASLGLDSVIPHISR